MHTKVSVICTSCTPLNTVSAVSTSGFNRVRKGKNQKNTAQMRHSCALSGRKPPQEPCASTSSPSPSKMERGLGGEARDNCDKSACTDGRVLPTSGGSYRHYTPNTRKSAAGSRRGDPVRMAPVGTAASTVNRRSPRRGPSQLHVI